MDNHTDDAHYLLAPSDVEQHLVRDHHADLSEITALIADHDVDAVRDWLLNYDEDYDTADEQSKREAILSVFHNVWHDARD